MDILLVAQDVAPSNALDQLGRELESRGTKVNRVLGFGKPLTMTTDEIVNWASRSDVVLSGISSSVELAEPEIAACQAARKAMVPFGFFGDTYGSAGRAADQWLAPLRSSTKFFFALNDEEAATAAQVFAQAEVIVTGNPLWEQFAFPKYTRSQVRQKLHSGDDEILILSPGGKSAALNIMLWGSIIQAVSYCSERYRLAISRHPGDRFAEAVDSQSGQPLNMYDELIKFSPIHVQWLPESISTSEALPGADVVIESYSTIGIEAAYQRIPVITVETALAVQRLHQVMGVQEWEAIKLGVAIPAAPDSIHGSLQGLQTKVYRKRLADRQAEVYPTPTGQGATVAKMADVLERLF